MPPILYFSAAVGKLSRLAREIFQYFPLKAGGAK